MKNTLPYHLSNPGFTMMEVLVTIVVLSIGLLGLANMQSRSIQYSQHAYYHGIAAQQARDMADRMRSNIQGVLAGFYDNINGIPAAAPVCFDPNANCTTVEISQFDALQWNNANANILPQGTGTVTVGATPSLFNIQVSWQTSEGAKTYSMRFQP